MDPRIEILAHNLLDYSLNLQSGQRLLLEGEVGSSDLLLALMSEAYKRGAQPFLELHDSRLHRGWLLGADRKMLETRTAWNLRKLDDTDAHLFVHAGDNASELVDVPAKTMEAYRRASEPYWDELLKKKWCTMRFPTPSAAQAAGMSTEAFEDFCFAVCSIDYSRMSRAMDPLVELMAHTDAVRIIGPGTDLSFSIAGIPAIKAAGECNVPDGEVFTAPVKVSVNGTVTFNTSSLHDGVTHDRVCLTLKEGRIVDADGSERERLNQVLDTDEGARYLGEFAFGVNPLIERPTKDILYDEKIAGSLHLTPGRAYEEADNGNRSSVHWDLVVIQTPSWGGGEVWFDGVLVRKDGRFMLPELEGLNPENLV